MIKGRSYRLTEYKITESVSGFLWWETHFGLGSSKRGQCFIRGNILFIEFSDIAEDGFLKMEFIEQLDRLPKWRKTKYYCLNYKIYNCKTGVNPSLHEMIAQSTLMSVIRIFDNIFKNFVFVQIGVVDAGTFKGSEEISRLHTHTDSEASRYVDYMKQHGYYAESFTAIGNDVIKEVIELAPKIKERFSNVVFFGGQLVFPEESFVTKWLHNYITFALQRRFYYEGTPFMIMPIRV